MKDRLDQEFLSTLRRHEPVTIHDLCGILGVTATAVRQRLQRLQVDGLVSRQLARQDRGRPHHTYAVTSEGLKTLGDDQGPMAALLWREIMAIEQPEVRNRVLSGVKQALVQRFGTGEVTGNTEERLQELCTRLSWFGFDVDYVDEKENGDSANSQQLPVLREHNCPYHEIAADDPSICEFERSVFSEILGLPLALSACRLGGDRCCEFQVGTAG